jgi:hypothetical protein
VTSDLHRTAVHEAGHAVCAFLLSVEAGAVTIEPNGDNAGLCEVIPCYHPRRKLMTIEKHSIAGRQTTFII